MGYDARWKKIRLQVLSDDPYCFVCGAPANEVHHVTPLAEGGTHHQENLRPVCKPCHSRITAREQRTNAGRKAAAASMVYVTGPPGSGKSTYVRDHKAGTDVVWDFDLVASALTMTDLHSHPRHVIPLVLTMRDAFLSYVETRRLKAWVITSRFNPEEAQWFKGRGAVVVVQDVAPPECMRRLMQRGDVERYRSAVNAWWASYRHWQALQGNGV